MKRLCHNRWIVTFVMMIALGVSCELSAAYVHAARFQPPPPPPGEAQPTPAIRSATSIADNERFEYFGYIAEGIHFAFEYPKDWNAFVADEDKNVDVASNETEDTFIKVRIVEGAGEELLTLVGNWYMLEHVEPVPHETSLALSFTYNQPAEGENTNNGLLSGRGFAFDLLEVNAQVIITVEKQTSAPLNWDTSKEAEIINQTFATLTETLTVERVDTNDLTLIELPLRSYQDATIGFEIEYPIVWEPLQYDDNSDWFVTLSDTDDAGIYIYPIFGQSSLEAICEHMLATYQINRTGDYVATELDGYDALEFDLEYKFNGEWTGRAIAVNLNGIGLIFSVDLQAPLEEVIPFYERIVRTIDLPETTE